MGRGFRSLRGDDATLVTRGGWTWSSFYPRVPSSRHFLNILVRPHVDAHIAGQHGAARTHTCTRTTRPTTRGDDARSARRHLRTPARATWFPPARALASTSCVTSALPHPGREYCIHKRGVAAASHISHARSSTPPPTLHAPPPTARHLHSGLQPGCSLTWIPRRAAPRGRVRGAGGCTDTECGR